MARSMLAFLTMCWACACWALSGIEFFQMDTVARVKVARPFIEHYVSYGYKNVPDEYQLANRMADLIRKYGYRYQPVDDIAQEAAISLGMTK